MSDDKPGIWGRIGRLIGAAAPVLGGMVAGPGGAALAGSIAAALGVEPTPTAIEQALRQDPNAAVKLAQIEADLEKTKLQTERDVQVAVEQTHQAALNQADLRTKRTRPDIARQSWILAAFYAVVTIFGKLIDPFVEADLSTLVFDSVAFGTLAGPAVWYMGMRTADKWKQSAVRSPFG